MIDEEVRQAQRVIERAGAEHQVVAHWVEAMNFEELKVLSTSIDNAKRTYRRKRIERARIVDKSKFKAYTVNRGVLKPITIFRWDGMTAVLDTPHNIVHVSIFDDEGYCFGLRTSSWNNQRPMRFNLEEMSV